MVARGPLALVLKLQAMQAAQVNTLVFSFSDFVYE